MYDLHAGTYFYPLNVSQFPSGTDALGITGISGETLVGVYHTTFPRGGGDFGFIATIPEPSSLILVGIAAAFFAFFATRRARGRDSPAK